MVELTHKETSGNTKPYRKRTDDGAIFFNYHRDELRNTHLNLIEYIMIGDEELCYSAAAAAAADRS